MQAGLLIYTHFDKVFAKFVDLTSAWMSLKTSRNWEELWSKEVKQTWTDYKIKMLSSEGYFCSENAHLNCAEKSLAGTVYGIHSNHWPVWTQNEQTELLQMKYALKAD